MISVIVIHVTQEPDVNWSVLTMESVSIKLVTALQQNLETAG